MPPPPLWKNSKQKQIFSSDGFPKQGEGSVAVGCIGFGATLFLKVAYLHIHPRMKYDWSTLLIKCKNNNFNKATWELFNLLGHNKNYEKCTTIKKWGQMIHCIEEKGKNFTQESLLFVLQETQRHNYCFTIRWFVL